MQRIILLNRYFFPDQSATSQILSDLAFHLAGFGYDVHVITSRQRYDDSRANLPRFEVVNGVAIHRLSTTRLGRLSLLGRSIEYLSFYLAARRRLIGLARLGDIIVAKTDPPLLGVLASHVGRARDLRVVNWLQDLYPEVAIELRVPLVKGLLGKALKHLRDRSLRMAAATVVVGLQMADRVRALGVEADRVHFIPNWCDDETICPIDCSDNPLRRKWGLEGKFVIGYSGNLGRAHEFGTVLAAAHLLRSEPRIAFLFIGGGYGAEELARRVKAEALNHLFRFVPYQERSELRYSLCVPDVHWVSLRPELEGLIVPSKFYGIAAAGRPTIAIGATDGEIASAITRYDCGVVVAPGDAKALAAIVGTLSAEPLRVAAMGEHARKMLDEHFTRAQAFTKWRDVLRSCELGAV